MTLNDILIGASITVLGMVVTYLAAITMEFIATRFVKEV